MYKNTIGLNSLVPMSYYYLIHYSRITGYHFVINGCNRDHPMGIREVKADERHATVCCEETLKLCVPRNPQLTYTSAAESCKEYGKSKQKHFFLCPRTKELNSMCCNERNVRGDATMWIADKIPPRGMYVVKV